MDRRIIIASTYLANIRPQDTEQVGLTLGLPGLESLAQLIHHPARVPFASILRRTEYAAYAMSCYKLYSVVGSNESPLANGLTTADDSSIFLAAARRLVDESPSGQSAVFGQVLLCQHLFSSQIGWKGEDASPFVAVGLLLGDDLLGRGHDEVEIGRVTVREGGRHCKCGGFDDRFLSICYWQD